MQLTDNVVSAIHAIFGKNPSIPQSSASEFLLGFADSTDAWSTLLEILHNVDYQVYIHYFAANLLHEKIRKHYSALPIDQQSIIMENLDRSANVLGNLYLIEGRRTGESLNVMHKLYACIALVRLNCQETYVKFTEKVLEQLKEGIVNAEMHNTNLICAFESLLPNLLQLRFLSQEFDENEKSCFQEDSIGEVNKSYSPIILQHLERLYVFLRDSNGGHAHELIQVTILQCWKRWMQYFTGNILCQYSHIIFMIIGKLCVNCEVDIALHSVEILIQAFESYEPSTSIELDQSLPSLASGIWQTREPFEHALKTGNDALYHGIASTVATFCEVFASWIIQDKNEHTARVRVNLAEYSLHILKCPQRRTAALSLEFWLIVQEQPIRNRHPYFQKEAFKILLDVLLRQCMYPADIAGADELELHEITSLRDESQLVQDILISVCALMKTSYLGVLLQSIVNAQSNTWSCCEVALYAIHVVTPAIQNHQEKESECMTDELLLQLCQYILNGQNVIWEHPFLVNMASKVLGQLALHWFATLERGPHKQASCNLLLQSIKFVTAAMKVKQSQSSAARSYMHILTCSNNMSNIDPRVYLLTSSVMHELGMDVENRLIVVEGFVRVAIASSQPMAFLEPLVSDIVMCTKLLHAQLESESCATEFQQSIILNRIAEELRILCKMLSIIEGSVDTTHTSTIVRLIEHIWPHFAPFPRIFLSSVSSLDAIFEFYALCIQCLRENISSQLPYLIDIALKTFEMHPSNGPLRMTCTLLDIFGKLAVSDKKLLSGFCRVFDDSTSTTHRMYEANGENVNEIMTDYFKMLYRYLILCPEPMLSSTKLFTALRLGRLHLSQNDRQSLHANLMFWIHLMEQLDTTFSFWKARILEILLGDYRQWIEATVLAFSTHSPSILIDQIGKFSLLFMQRTLEYSTEMKALDYYYSAWNDAITDPSNTLGMQAIPLTIRLHLLQCWCQLALHRPAGWERKYRNLCSDFAKSCRQERTPEILLEYEC